MIKFKTKNGQLTTYALCCGYMEHEITNNISTKLWKEPGCAVYQVQQHDYTKGNRIFWDSFDTKTKAYKRYDKAIKVNGR